MKRREPTAAAIRASLDTPTQWGCTTPSSVPAPAHLTLPQWLKQHVLHRKAA